MPIASFTQTYGNNRILELLLLKYDIIGNTFRNKCDLIIFSFHNCSENFVKAGTKILEEIYLPSKLKILVYNNISYLDSVRKTLKFLRENKYDYILQIQDDQHGINSQENISKIELINNMFDFLADYKPYFFHIFSNEGGPKFNKIIPLQIVNVSETVFYKYNSKEFSKKNIYSWNDGTYFAKTDFLQNLFNLNLDEDVWQIEVQLKQLFDTNEIIRWGSDKIYFKASNIHGKNINRNLSLEDNLKRFFGDLETWNNVKKILPRTNEIIK